MSNEATYISAFNKLIGGRIIGLNTEFIKLFGGNEAILLAQCCYYDVSIAKEKKALLTNKAGEKSLYWEHTDDQWYNEIHFGETALKNAKGKLVDAGVIEIIRAGLPAKSQYRVNLQKIIELLAGNTSENTGTSSDETPELDQVFHRNIKDNNTKDNKTKNIKEDKDIEFFVKNSVSPETVQASQQEKEEPNNELIPSNQNNSSNRIDFDVEKIPNIVDSKTTENHIENELNKKSNKVKKSNSALNPKEKEVVTAEQAAIRAEIKRFLAHKCLHAANEIQMARLTGTNKVRLNNAAQTLEQFGALPTHMPELWKHFVAGNHWQGEKVAAKPSMISSPEYVAECWNSFENNGFKAAIQPEKTKYQPRKEQSQGEENYKPSFNDKAEDYEIPVSLLALMLTEDAADYPEIRANWIQRYGQAGEEQVINYENSNDYKLKFGLI